MKDFHSCFLGFYARESLLELLLSCCQLLFRAFLDYTYCSVAGTHVYIFHNNFNESFSKNSMIFRTKFLIIFMDIYSIGLFGFL